MVTSPPVRPQAQPAASSHEASQDSTTNVVLPRPCHRMPDWVRHGIWWQVYPLGFVGADIRPDGLPRYRGRGLAALTPWLDYAVNLGVSGLLLGPIFTSSTHGYDTLDHMHVDPRLGGDEQFSELVQACHDHGLRLILDGVFNHVGRAHPAVRAALEGNAGSPWAGLVRTHADRGGKPTVDVFEGHDQLVSLDHDSSATVDYTARVMNHWLDAGADGWRLDAAYAVAPRFWARTLPLVRRSHPDTWIFGEVIHGDYPRFVKESGTDSLTQYELWKSIWSSLASGNFFELDWNLGRHNRFLDTFVPQTFIGNHDVTRIASRVGPQREVLALAVLMTVAGTPSIYYGDEQALTGLKEERAGGDDAVRPAFPDMPDGLADLAPAGGWMYRAHQDLIGLRRRHPWLVEARTVREHLDNRHYVYRSVSADGGHQLLVDLRLDPHPSVTITGVGGRTLYAYPQSC